jgi:DNA-binding transcriptional MerR regulator
VPAHRVQSLFYSAYQPFGNPHEQEKAQRALASFFVSADPRDFEIVERKPVNQSQAGRALKGADEQMGEMVEMFRAVTHRAQRQQDEIATLQAEIARLKEENDRLTKKLEEAEPVVVSDTGDEYVSWVEFEAAAITAFDRQTGWKAVFAFEADIDIKTLNAWQTVGVIPAKLFDIVKTLTADQKAPSLRKKWTVAEYDRLEALVAERKRDREIAKLLSAEFGRKLVESSIMGARRRLFRGR